MKLLYALLILLVPFFAVGQQLPKAGNFNDQRFSLNPAMTGAWDYWEVSVGYRQQWVGFNDAPKTAFLGFQLPVVDNNMAVGVSILHDRTNPLSFNAISLNYAYKIKTGIFYEDQLSVGLLATLSEYRLDYLEASVNDQDDNLLLGGASSAIQPNAGVGIFYTSHANNFEKTYFFFGAAVNQFFSQSLNFENGSDGNLKRALHGNAQAGLRFINEGIAIEPSVWLNYAHSGIINSRFSLNMERYESFWAGFAFSTDKTFSLQAGFILKQGFLKDGTLRIGTAGAYNLGGFGKYDGLGYEFYIAYRFNQ